MIKTHLCYTAACDVCGEEPEGPYGYGVDHCDTTTDALQDAQFAEWWATETAVLCNNHDPKHMATAHEIDRELRATASTDLAAFLEWLPQIWRDDFQIDQPKTFDAHMPGQTTLPIGS